MKPADEVSTQIHLFVEQGRWADGLNFLSKHWFSIRGTIDIQLISSIGQILIKNGYAEWAKNWLFERSLYHPRNGLIMRWLVEAVAELRDHTQIQQFGEIHEECTKVMFTPNEHLMNALLGLEKDQRFLEVHERQKAGLSPRGHRMYSQYCFYNMDDFENSVKVHTNLPKTCLSWEDFTSHGALSFHMIGESERGLEFMDLHLAKKKANSSITAFEMFRENDPKRALDFLNNSLKHYGYSPISERWADESFSLKSLCCDDIQTSDDLRLVSVIMTVHCMNPLFQTAVRSILEQSHQNLELLVIDDASNEEDYQQYQQILQRDPRTRLIRQTYNAGTYAARNRGLKEAKGEFVLFMDSDDWTHPQRIEKALSRLDKNPNTVVAVDSYARFHEDGKLAMVGSYFVRKCMLGLWRTQVVRDELGGFDSVRIAADSELLERAQLIYGKGSVDHVPALLYFAYFHHESLTGSREFGFSWRGIVGHRAKYAGAFRNWHRREQNSLKGYNMMEASEKEIPFKLPKRFHRTFRHQPLLKKPSQHLDQIRADCSSNHLSGFFQTPNAGKIPLGVKISICLATYPGRFKTVGRTVATLLNQTTPVDQIHIWVNESSVPPPLPNDPRVIVHLSPDDDLTDIGKFAAASLAPEGIIILADDDLNYPQDYVERMAKEVSRFDGEACIGVHGVVFPVGQQISDIDNYFSNRRVHLYSRGLSIYIPCHLLGTGTMAYDSRKIKFDYSRWQHRRMVDLHVGVECQRLGVAMITIPREQGWLNPFEPDEDDESIWESVKKDKTLQREMIDVLSQVKDWNYILHDGKRITEQDLLQSIEVSNEHSTTEIVQTEKVAISDSYNVMQRWKQQGRLLLFDALTRTVRFKMPLGWKIEDTSPDLFRLAHYLLTSPWEKGVLDGWYPSRKKGWRPSLSYSAGIDSHACLELMPKNTVIMYHKRSGFESALDHSNALEMLDTLEKDSHTVVCIESNHEQIRTDHGKNPGFSTDFAVGAHAILLADYFGISGVAFGMPLENSYLFHGHKGRDFQNSWYWLHYSEIFQNAGLDLILPTAGLSELINLEITKRSSLGSLAQSCLRSNITGKVCGECWKCFRKNSLRGEVAKISDEVQKFLNKEPLKQAVSTIYALQKISQKQPKLLAQFTHLEPLMSMDLGWLNRYHPNSSLFVPEDMRSLFLNKLNNIALPMSDEERLGVETLEIYVQNEE